MHGFWLDGMFGVNESQITLSLIDNGSVIVSPHRDGSLAAGRGYWGLWSALLCGWVERGQSALDDALRGMGGTRILSSIGGNPRLREGDGRCLTVT